MTCRLEKELCEAHWELEERITEYLQNCLQYLQWIEECVNCDFSLWKNHSSFYSSTIVILIPRNAGMQKRVLSMQSSHPQSAALSSVDLTYSSVTLLLVMLQKWGFHLWWENKHQDVLLESQKPVFQADASSKTEREERQYNIPEVGAVLSKTELRGFFCLCLSVVAFFYSVWFRPQGYLLLATKFFAQPPLLACLIMNMPCSRILFPHFNDWQVEHHVASLWLLYTRD